MNRAIAALMGFALPAIAAIYVALAPFGGSFASLDALAAQVTAAVDRDIAVPALLVFGAVLAAVAVLLFGKGPHQPPRIEMLPLPEEEEEETAEAAPAPAPVEDPRIEALRQAAQQDTEDAPDPAVPQPVILVRKARETARDWFSDRSWLGGLPRLGERDWPRDANGVPLPFAAQIDLADLARTVPGMALPPSGSLAFFLGSGAVIAVPDGTHDFAEPPADLPPAFDEGGAAFPAKGSRLTRWFFPFWPVELLALDLPEHLIASADPTNEIAIEHALTTQLQAHAPMRDHPFYAAGVGAPVEALWWHSVLHLTDQLHEAREASARPLAAQRAALDRKLAAFAQLQADPGATRTAVEHARQTAEFMTEELEEAEERYTALPEMVEALERFVAGRGQWVQLSPEELDVVGDILADIHERFGDLAHGFVPGSLAQLATISLRAMISGPPDALAAMPAPMLERINRDYRLPPLEQHLMFAPPASDREGTAGEILLLQLAYDDLMEWSWIETGLFQFRIDAEDAAAGNWGAAQLTFRAE